jgi:RluA family pseudouridine synthase
LNVRVLFCDNQLLVVEKPAGMPSQADESGDADLLETARAYVAQRYQKPGATFLGLLHRLDRPASGLMVLARTSKAARRLSRDFQNRSIGKIYLCVLQGRMEGSGTLQDWLVKEQRRVRVCSPQVAGAKFARLDYATLACHEQYTLVWVRLHTGRPHQIRLQFASRGFPILGDLRYGSREALGPALALHAALLELDHPTQAQRLLITSSFLCPIPPLQPALETCLSAYIQEFGGTPFAPHVWVKQRESAGPIPAGAQTDAGSQGEDCGSLPGGGAAG